MCTTPFGGARVMCNVRRDTRGIRKARALKGITGTHNSWVRPVHAGLGELGGSTRADSCSRGVTLPWTGGSPRPSRPRILDCGFCANRPLALGRATPSPRPQVPRPRAVASVLPSVVPAWGGCHLYLGGTKPGGRQRGGLGISASAIRVQSRARTNNESARRQNITPPLFDY